MCFNSYTSIINFAQRIKGYHCIGIYLCWINGFGQQTDDDDYDESYGKQQAAKVEVMNFANNVRDVVLFIGSTRRRVSVNSKLQYKADDAYY